MADRQGPTLAQLYRLRRELHGPGLEALKDDRSDPELHELRLQILSEMQIRFEAMTELMKQRPVPPDILSQIESLEARIAALEEHREKDK